MYSHFKITQTAATVAELMGIDAPKGSAAVNELVYAKAKAALPKGVDSYDRVLMYNPDAVAWWLYQKYTHLFAPAVMNTDIQIPATSMVPSITPVCFASMYTGLEPKEHGITGFMWPVLTVETLFDTAIRAGKKCAIVSTWGDSMSRIYLERDMDYYIKSTYPEVFEKALEVVAEDKYDLVCVYNATYDATMHTYTPEHEKSLAVLEKNCRDFVTLLDAVRTHWAGHNTFYGFCTDHGCHATDMSKVKPGDKVCPGGHGADIDVDMNVVHMFGSHIG